jgi:hypothetical protein
MCDDAEIADVLHELASSFLRCAKVMKRGGWGEGRNLLFSTCYYLY